MICNLKFIISIISSIRYIPHIIYYLCNKKKFVEDIKVGTAHYLGKEYYGVLGLIFLLTFSRMFRNLFYHRVGLMSISFKWMCRPYNSFIIDNKTEIGEGMNCIHPFSTIINAKKIGKFFTIKNNVTIGDNRPNEKPIIGNNVTINVNSVVFGNITIGDNVVIGAGSLVNKNVPPNCIVIGNPAKIIRQNGKRVNISL